jgi:uncharacterized damage-inducible protein DinB
MPKRVPLIGAEKPSLQVSLDRHRDAVLWKLEGLDDEQVRRSLVPSGTNLLGLVKHLAGVEYQWFGETFGREPEAVARLEQDPVADLRAGPDETTADIVAYYQRARAASDRAVEELDIEAIGTAWFGEKVSMRRVLIGMIEETARHAGQMDILRELIDGSTGSHPPD